MGVVQVCKMQCGSLRFARAFPRSRRRCNVGVLARPMLFGGMASLVWIALGVAYCWWVVALYRTGWPRPRGRYPRIVLRTTPLDAEPRRRRSGE